MTETPQQSFERRAAERRAVIRDASALARRADAVGLTAIAQVLDLAMALTEGDLGALGRDGRPHGPLDATRGAAKKN